MKSVYGKNLVILTFMLITIGCNAPLEFPKVSDGYIDLSTQDFSENRLFPLDGEWHFYHQELLTPQEIIAQKPTKEYIRVPDKYWHTPRAEVQDRPQYSYGTYQVKINIPKDCPDLGLQTYYISTACKIYVNNELWLERGEVGKNAATTTWSLTGIREQLPVLENELILTIQVSNFVYPGGISKKLYIGKAAYIHAKSRDLLLYKLLLFGGALFLGLFFIITYFINKLDKASLYFGLILIFFFYWNCSSDGVFHHYYPGFDWNIALRLDHFAIFIYIYAVIGFVQTSSSAKDYFPAFTKFAQSLELSFAILVWFIPISWEYTFVDVYHRYLLAFYLVYYNISIVIRSALVSLRKSLRIILVSLILIVNFAIDGFRDEQLWFTQERFTFFVNIVMLLIMTVIIIYEQFEKRMELSRQAMVAADAKTQFLSVISHEMRTPMNGILGMSDFLADTKLDKQQQEYLQSIQTSGKSLIALIDDLLDTTRIQQGKLRIEAESFDLHALIIDINNALQALAQNKGLYLKYDIAENVPQYVISDAMRVKQVIDNLVNNAIKFTEEGGIHIKVWADEIAAEKTNIHFQIRDTGIGISEAQQQQIFGKFQQVDTTHSRRYQGVGLGLSICKQIIELMGGTIKVESELGVGSTFEFYIQLSKSTAPANSSTPPIATEKTLSGSLEILIAEDNVINEKLIRMGLNKLGYTADSVPDGREAVQAVHKKAYDLVLMDLQMPEMDGITATKAIKASKDIESPYIVALSANAFEDDKLKALEAGMDDYLIKPVKIQAIKELLRMLEKKKQQNQAL